MKTFRLIVVIGILFGAFSLGAFPGDFPEEEKSLTERYWEQRKLIEKELNNLESISTQLLTSIKGIYTVDRGPWIKLKKNIAEMKNALAGIDQSLREIEADDTLAPDTADDKYLFLGTEWQVTEIDPGKPGRAGRKWIGTWKRQPNSSTFDATWTLNGAQVGAAVVTFVSLDPRTREIKLQRGSGFYTGILAPGGKSVRSGRATWYEDQETWYWHAVIID